MGDYGKLIVWMRVTDNRMPPSMTFPDAVINVRTDGGLEVVGRSGAMRALFASGQWTAVTGSPDKA